MSILKKGLFPEVSSIDARNDLDAIKKLSMNPAVLKHQLKQPRIEVPPLRIQKKFAFADDEPEATASLRRR